MCPVVSCNGAGKTTLAARLLLWFMMTRRDAIVVTSAPTWHQVSLLWREVRTAFADAEFTLKGELMTTRLDIGPSWYAMGLSTDREERFQGFHAKGADPGGPGGLMVIIDEASGVADHIFDAMRGYLTSPNTYCLLIGNGTRPDGAFFDSHQKGNWERFQIAAHDVPREDHQPKLDQRAGRILRGGVTAVLRPRPRQVPASGRRLPACA